jgi:hypothetical protein
MLQRMNGWFADFMEDVAHFRKRPVAQLATIGTDGRPAVRSVVLRGLTDAGAFWFTTDGRSQKPTSGDAEICIWLPERSTQWRFAGELALHGPRSEEADIGALLDEGWAGTDDDARRQMAGPPPGTLRIPDAAVPGLPNGVSDNFRVGLVTPNQADRLVLSRPHQRTIWRPSEGAWDGHEVHP